MTFDLPQAVNTFSLEVMKQSYGRDYWSELHGYPRFGFAITSHRFGNPDVLGHALGFYPQLDVFLMKKRNFSIISRLAFGLAYVTRPYHRITNPTNLAIGSRLNNYTTIGLAAEYQVTPHWRLRIGGNITHVSNGKVQSPNLGINTATARVGLSYVLQPPAEPLTFDYEAIPPNRRWQPNFRLSLGLREAKVADGPRYGIYTVSGFLSKMYTRKGKVFFGLEASFNHATYAWLKDQDIPPELAEKPHNHPWRYTAVIGHEFVFGRIGFMTHVFLYLDPPFDNRNFFGTRLGPNLYFKKPHQHKGLVPFVGIYMKAHYSIAELVELTLGARF